MSGEKESSIIFGVLRAPENKKFENLWSSLFAMYYRVLEFKSYSMVDPWDKRM